MEKAMKSVRRIGVICLCFLATVSFGGCSHSLSGGNTEQSPGASAPGNAISGAGLSVSGQAVAGQAASGQSVSASAVTGVVDLTPYVVLGKYKGVSVSRVWPEKVKNATVMEKIEQRMEAEAGEKQELDGAITKGDYVRVTFQGYLGDALVEEARVENMTLQIGQYTMLKDFEDGLIGAGKGDILTISVKIPDQYPKEYAGKTMEYDVKVLDAWKMETPKLTDANVQKYLSEKSVKVLKEKIRKQLEDQYKSEAEQRTGQMIMNQVIKNAKFRECPENYLDEFAAEVRKGYEADAAARNLDMVQYISQMGLAEQEYEQQVQKIARADLEAEMVYQAIIKKEGLTLTEEEFREGAEDYVDGSMYRTAQEVIEKTDRDRLEQRILYKKAYDLVVSNAVIEKDD